MVTVMLKRSQSMVAAKGNHNNDAARVEDDYNGEDGEEGDRVDVKDMFECLLASH